MNAINKTGSDLVSIIIPCYRQGRYLAEAIQSALHQSYGNIEIIVVDDGSDDDTEAVARSFGDRVHYLRRKNGGPAAARNSGLAKSRGRYLLFLDADDILDCEAVGWLLAAAGDRERVLCVMGVRFFRHDVLERGKIQMPPCGLLAPRRLLVNNINPPMAFLCARSMVLAAGGFDPSPRVNACEDWDMWMRLLFAGAEVIGVPVVGASYRLHPNSHSSNEVRMCRSRCEVLRRTRHHIRGHSELGARLDWDPAELSAELSRLIAEEYALAAYVLRQRGRYTAAFQSYWMSLWRGRWNQPALFGACKLLPHKVSCRMGWVASG